MSLTRITLKSGSLSLLVRHSFRYYMMSSSPDRPSVPSSILNTLEALLCRSCTDLMLIHKLPQQSWTTFNIRPIKVKPKHSQYTHTTPTIIQQAQQFTLQQQPQQQQQRHHASEMIVRESKGDDNTNSPAKRVRREHSSPDAESPYQSLAYQWALLIESHAAQLLEQARRKHLHNDDIQQSYSHLIDWDISLNVPHDTDTRRGRGFIDFAFKYRKQEEHIQQDAASTQSTSPHDHSATLMAVSQNNNNPIISVSQSISAALYTFSPIGYLDSCYKLKYGTPRQGSIAPSSRAKLTLLSHISPTTLCGLAAYSHAWLIFVFHDNGPHDYNKAKVKPPRLHGEKMGIFATRSPHRINPIGLSLVHIDRVDEDTSTLYLSSIDLIQGTPILDIKPYHPADTPNTHQLSLPSWLTDRSQHSLNVHINDIAMQQLILLLPQLSFFSSLNEAFDAIKDSISFDPRPTYIVRKQDPTAVYGFRLDALNVCYSVDDIQRIATVCCIELVTDDDNTDTQQPPVANDTTQAVDEKLKTHRWLKRVGRRTAAVVAESPVDVKR